uniref:(northern house mosquito) hypothetical protein n=1 Tax=Culex pipiens TaxID=7175 RepID=A0A8D8BML8_CULPI
MARPPSRFAWPKALAEAAVAAGSIASSAARSGSSFRQRRAGMDLLRRRSAEELSPADESTTVLLRSAPSRRTRIRAPGVGRGRRCMVAAAEHGPSRRKTVRPLAAAAEGSRGHHAENRSIAN